MRGDALELSGGVSETTVRLPPRLPPSDLEASLPLRLAPAAPLQEPPAAASGAAGAAGGSCRLLISSPPPAELAFRKADEATNGEVRVNRT